MKNLRDLTKQPFPADVVTPELISSVTISTLNKWIVELGIIFNNLSKAKRQEKEEALLQYLRDREGKTCEDSEEEEEEAEAQGEEADDDDNEEEEKEKMLEDVFNHVRKKVKSDVEIAKDQIEIAVKVRIDLLSLVS